jgi:purine-nucleoside phosphorylase
VTARESWERSVRFLTDWLKDEQKPELAIVLGSGLGSVIPQLHHSKRISYQQIPGFKATHVAGHGGELVYGVHEKDGRSKAILLLSGRNHGYEGHSVHQVVHNVRSVIGLGVKGIVLTNAAGCLAPQFKIGTPMLITDQINLTGKTPIEGSEFQDLGPLFLDMTCAYHKEWQTIIRDHFKQENKILFEGVYAGLMGPTYETPAEVRMLQGFGAQSVGMSTVWECIAAKHMGAKVAGISCLTNFGAGLIPSELVSHDDVLANGKNFANEFGDALFGAFLKLN